MHGVLIHDPDSGYMPTQACRYGRYPSQIQTEWRQHGDIFPPNMPQVIKSNGSGINVSEIQQGHLYRRLAGNEAPDELFDPVAIGLRAPAMDFFERSFAKMNAGKD